MERKIILNDRFDLRFDGLGNKWIVDKSKAGKKKEGDTYCGYHWHFGPLLQSFALKVSTEKEPSDGSVEEALLAYAQTEQTLLDIANRIGDELDRKLLAIARDINHSG